MTALRLVCNLVKKAPSISLVIHQRPDGDALGSAAALYKYFSPTKKVEIICATDVSKVFEKVTGKLPIKKKLGDSRVIILLDCAQWHRTGFEKELTAAKESGAVIVSFDHHERHNLDHYVTQSINDPSASSTTQVLFDCFQEFREPFSQEIAQCLLLGIFTDTGCFRHPNTTSQTLKIASRLISAGANLAVLQNLFDDRRTIAKTKLWGQAFSTVSINAIGLAVVKIDVSMMTRAGANSDDVAGLANSLALLHEARAAVVLVETEKGWRATLRTRHSDVDLRRLAKYFDGRGIQKATGFFATNELISGKISSV